MCFLATNGYQPTDPIKDINSGSFDQYQPNVDPNLPNFQSKYFKNGFINCNLLELFKGGFEEIDPGQWSENYEQNAKNIQG